MRVGEEGGLPDWGLCFRMDGPDRKLGFVLKDRVCDNHHGLTPIVSYGIVYFAETLLITGITSEAARFAATPL